MTRGEYLKRNNFFCSTGEYAEKFGMEAINNTRKKRCICFDNENQDVYLNCIKCLRRPVKIDGKYIMVPNKEDNDE